MNAAEPDIFGQSKIDISQFGLDLSCEGIKSWIFGKRKSTKDKNSCTFIFPEYLEPIIRKHAKKFQVNYNPPHEIKATLDTIFEEYTELDAVKEELSKLENFSKSRLWNLFYSEVVKGVAELREATEDIIKSFEKARNEYSSEYALQSLWIDFFEEVADSIQKISTEIRKFRRISMYRTSKKNKERFFHQVKQISLICFGVIPVAEKIVFQFEKVQKRESIQENEREALTRQMALFDMILGCIERIEDIETSFDYPFHRRSFEDRSLDPLMIVLLS